MYNIPSPIPRLYGKASSFPDLDFLESLNIQVGGKQKKKIQIYFKSVKVVTAAIAYLGSAHGNRTSSVCLVYRLSNVIQV